MILARRREAAPAPAYGIPYPMPTSPPYNAPTYCVTPTADGSASTVHPSVVDFGSGRKWNDHRYWMAVTGFYLTNDDLENPHILASNDGFHWQPPPGLTNPVYPMPPGGVRFNSDTDLEYDPRSDELVMIYREQQLDNSQQVFLARSPNGTLWPARPQVLNWTRPEATGQVLSPALIRRAEGDWWLFGIFERTSAFIYYRASAPEGPWTGPTTAATTLPAPAWHLDVIWDGAAFRALIDKGPRYKGAADGYAVGSSVNGNTWAWNPTNVMDLPASGWDSIELYRASIAPHENGTHMRLWYSAEGPESWRVGYTELPVSLWPA